MSDAQVSRILELALMFAIARHGERAGHNSRKAVGLTRRRLIAALKRNGPPESKT